MPARRLAPALLALLAACGDPAPVVPPSMELSTTSLTFGALAGAQVPAAQVVEVTDADGGALGVPSVGITYQNGSGWLAATVSGAAPPYTVSVRPSTTSLAAGKYQATIRVASVSAANSPQSIAVTLDLGASILATRRMTAWGENGNGTTAAPDDVTSIAILADGAGGTVRTDLSRGGSAGDWVGTPPAGPWWAEVHWADGRVGYYRGSGVLLDLGEDVGGRPGGTPPVDPTMVTPVLNGLDPWDDNGTVFDALAAHAWGAQALGWFDETTDASFPLRGGETSLGAPYEFDWLITGGALLVASDVVRFTQYRPVVKFLDPPDNTQALEYLRAAASASTPGLGMLNGEPLALAPPDMTPYLTVEDGSLQLNWQRSEFEAALPPYAPPTSVTTGHLVGVYATPAPLAGTAPLGAVGLPLLVCPDPFGLADDFTGGPVTYARIQPAAWREYRHARFARDVDRRAPGAATGLPGAQDLVQRLDAIGSAPATIRPLVSAVTSPTVDGQSALAAGLTGVSRTPTLAWAAPATGTPTRYRVELVRLTESAGATVGAAVGELVVGGATTSVALPAGLLEGAATYVARITARSSPTDATGVAPFRAGLPYGDAALWTATFTTVP